MYFPIQIPFNVLIWMFAFFSIYMAGKISLIILISYKIENWPIIEGKITDFTKYFDANGSEVVELKYQFQSGSDVITSNKINIYDYFLFFDREYQSKEVSLLWLMSRKDKVDVFYDEKSGKSIILKKPVKDLFLFVFILFVIFFISLWLIVKLDLYFSPLIVVSLFISCFLLMFFLEKFLTIKKEERHNEGS